MRNPLSICWIFVLLSGLSSVLEAADPVRVRLLDGSQVEGELRSLSATEVKLQSPASQVIPLPQVLRVDWPENHARNPLSQPVVVFPNGDLWCGQIAQLSVDVAQGKWSQFPAWDPLEIRLETLKGAVLRPIPDTASRVRMLQQIEEYSARQDQLWLINGDVVTGEIAGADLEWRVDSVNGQLALPADRVRAFALNPELTVAPPRPAQGAVVQLIDGSRLTVQLEDSAPNGDLKAVTTWGTRLSLPQGQVASVQFFGPGIQWLSDLNPVDYQATPFLDRAWPWKRNRQVRGGILAMGDRQYVHGLGLHSQARLQYALEGKFATFQTDVGLDALAGWNGSVVVKILADGENLFTSEIIRTGAPPQAVGPLSVQGRKTLTLIVEFADFGDLDDLVDFGEPVLLAAP